MIKPHPSINFVQGLLNGMDMVVRNAIDRSHLMILREVVRRGTVTAAAEALCLSQSALSHSITKLEDRLGVSLWHKQGRRLQLTSSGEQLLALAHRVLPPLEAAERRLERLANGEEGRLRIGVECYPCYHWLQGILVPYMRAWPAVSLDIKQQYQFCAVAALKRQDIDLVVTPDPPEDDLLKFWPVMQYEQVLVVHQDHKLAKYEQIDPESLVDETLITYPIGPERLDIFYQFLHPAGVQPKAHLHLEATDLLLEMVAQCRGVAALPRWLVDGYKHLPLKAITLGKTGIWKQLCMGVRLEDRNLQQVERLIAMAIEHSNVRYRSDLEACSNVQV
jgi:LysR family transcriptional regulator for metE and metH